MKCELKAYLAILFAPAILAIAAAPPVSGQAETQPPSLAKQAVSIVLKHYMLNPLVLDPKTEQPLPGSGDWSVGNTPPPACPQTAQNCAEVFYQVPAESVRCSWTVLVNADGTDGTLLDENEDAERYLIRRVSGSEASAQVDTRKKPVFSPIAILAHINGVVVVSVVVDKSGVVQNAVVVSGPPMLTATSLDAAQYWKFKPLMLGSKAIPYAVRLEFTFHTTGPGDSKVAMTP